MLWIIVGVVAWFAFGYLAARYMLKIDEIDHDGSAFAWMLLGPILSAVALLFWIAAALELTDTEKISRKFFHLKEYK